VQAVHFVAQGTIEEGMLSVLNFKKSLFAGVLDGGEKEVFLGGTRLTKFMETVESVTGRVGQLAAPEIAEPPGPAAFESEEEEPSTRTLASPDRPPTPRQPAPTDGTPVAQVRSSDPFANLLQGGLALLQQLSGQFTARQTNRDAAASGDGSSTATSPIRWGRDENTGRPTLNVTLPEPEVLDEILGAVSTFLDDLRGRRS
jgi:hypothetical protein